jgi:hypothetical protein
MVVSQRLLRGIEESYEKLVKIFGCGILVYMTPNKFCFIKPPMQQVYVLFVVVVVVCVCVCVHVGEGGVHTLLC